MRRFSKADLKFLKSCGVSVQGMRSARECRIECQQIFEPTFAKQRMVLAQRIAKHTPPGIPEDETVRMLRKVGIPVTAENWMRLNFAGHPPTPPFDGELAAELPNWILRTYGQEEES